MEVTVSKWLIRSLAIGGLPDFEITTIDVDFEGIATRLAYSFGVRFTVHRDKENNAVATLISGLHNQSNFYVWRLE
jgi:hypothetical protein